MGIKEVIKQWKEENKKSVEISDEKLYEFAVNCIALSDTWFDNVKNEDDFAYEVDLFDKDKNKKDTLQGVNRNNLPLVLLKSITFDKDEISCVRVNSYQYTDGHKHSKIIGTLDIS